MKRASRINWHLKVAIYSPMMTSSQKSGNSRLETIQKVYSHLQKQKSRLEILSFTHVVTSIHKETRDKRSKSSLQSRFLHEKHGLWKLLPSLRSDRLPCAFHMLYSTQSTVSCSLDYHLLLYSEQELLRSVEQMTDHCLLDDGLLRSRLLVEQQSQRNTGHSSSGSLIGQKHL